MTGPNSAPATAAASAVPVYWPRRSRGAVDQPPEYPGPRGGAADALDEARDVQHHYVVGEGKATLDTTSRPSPSSTVGRTPTRAAIQPPGSAPTNVPAGYAAASTPAAVLVRS